MFNVLERLSDKFNILTHNIRELLFKLYVWDNTTNNIVNVKLRTEDSPYFEEFTIPSKKAITENTAIGYGISTIKNNKVSTLEINGDLNLSYFEDAKYQYIYHTDTNNYKIILTEGRLGDVFEFVVETDSGLSSCNLTFYSKTVSSTILKISKSDLKIKYKISIQCVENPLGDLYWTVLDFYKML